MIKINFFNVGLILMFLFILISVILNVVSIATTQWLDPTVGDTSPWIACNYPLGAPSGNSVYRPKCFLDVPPALIATGTAFNILSLLLMGVSLLALCLAKFRNSYALYFVIGAEATTLLGLIFKSIGWYFIISLQYQNIVSIPNNTNAGFKYGWSFWIMIGSITSTIIAAIIGSSILGCTCITNKRKFEKNNERNFQSVVPVYEQNQYHANGNKSVPLPYEPETISIKKDMAFENRAAFFPSESNDEQVFRL